MSTCRSVQVRLALNEPLEGVDSIEVLFSRTILTIYSGFQRRFASLILSDSDIPCPSSSSYWRTYRRRRLSRCSFWQERFWQFRIFILDFRSVSLVFVLLDSDIRVQDWHVNMSICSSFTSFLIDLWTFSGFFLIYFLILRSSIIRDLYFDFLILFVFSLLSFQQHTGERKQMAKAIAAVSKSSKTPAPKKRSPSVSAAPPPKRRSYQPDRVVTCYNCQQTGHIAPRCPSRPASSSTPSSKAVPKKWGASAAPPLNCSLNKVFPFILYFSLSVTYSDYIYFSFYVLFSFISLRSQ